MDVIEVIIRDLVNAAVQYVPLVLLAIVTLIIGLSLIRRLVKFISKALTKQVNDPTLTSFLKALISALLKIVLFISVASMVGIETTSFVAVIGAAGLAVGLALQGSLANFAGGVLILLLRPFKVGDVVETQGFLAVVKEIQIFYTIFKTFDNKIMYVPNGPLANGNITNYSSEEERRVDMVFGVGYNDDFKKAKSILMDMIQKDERIFKDKPGQEPFLRVTELADSSVNITMRAWCKSGDYWDIYFDFLENVKTTFDQEGVGIPFPHMEVYTHQVQD